MEMPTINIHGKEYVLVKDRVLAFNEKYPNGSIETHLAYDGEMVRCRAVVIPDVANMNRRFTGHSEEDRSSSAINKTSATENAETSAIGRALAAMGIGVLDSIASVDEMNKATNKANNKPLTETNLAILGVKKCPKCGKEHSGKYAKCLDCWKASK